MHSQQHACSYTMARHVDCKKVSFAPPLQTIISRTINRYNNIDIDCKCYEYWTIYEFMFNTKFDCKYPCNAAILTMDLKLRISALKRY